MGNNGQNAVAERQQDNADIVAIDAAATEVAANGGGDIAVSNARLAKIEELYVNDCMIADGIRDSALSLASVYVQAGKAKTAANMRENAQRDHREALDAARERKYDRIARFAVESGSWNLVPADQIAAVFRSQALAASRLEQRVLQAAHAHGTDTIDLGNGTVWNVEQRLAAFAKLPPTVS